MIKKKGIAVSRGIIAGEALVIGTEDYRIPHRQIKSHLVPSEKKKLHQAFEQVAEDISENERLASERIGKQYGAIFGAHLQMAQDPKLIGEIESLIDSNNYTAEFASSRVLRKYAKQFQEIGNAYFAERATDIYDLEKRILGCLLGESREDLQSLSMPVIVLAHNLTPSETAELNREFVLGFATEVGGHTSHTAILAGAMEIPAVVGIGQFLQEVSGGEMVIIDGFKGEIIIDPDEQALKSYEEHQLRHRSDVERLAIYQDLEAVTQDGERIAIMGNVEFPEEAELCRKRGADGIGLYRTEFLYLGKNVVPTEEEHYQAYLKVIEANGDNPVVIRTMDLGADKLPGDMSHLCADKGSQALGLRSIRLSLHFMDLFRDQVRAILRVAADHDVSVMFPLVSSVMEFRQARLVVRDIMEELDEENVPFDRNIKIGIMVEVPSAAILASEFAREVDFFSIGTNDLIQYTLAADRADSNVAKWFSPGDPAILKLIDIVKHAAQEQGIPVSICGQMSAEPMFTPLLIGLGLRQLSVSPQSIPVLKEVIRALTISKAEEIARQTMSLDAARNVESYLRGEINKLCPDLMR